MPYITRLKLKSYPDTAVNAYMQNTWYSDNELVLIKYLRERTIAFGKSASICFYFCCCCYRSMPYPMLQLSNTIMREQPAYLGWCKKQLPFTLLHRKGLTCCFPSLTNYFEESIEYIKFTVGIPLWRDGLYMVEVHCGVSGYLLCFQFIT